jgi:hypothetical protein
MLRTQIHSSLIYLAIIFASATAQARFLESDANQVDSEERLSTETYNDKISYRFPTPWDRTWETSAAGYRISAGSLNVNRFNIEEQIKFSTPADKPVSFSFHQSRQEDVVESRLEQVLRVDWQPMNLGINLAIFAEGGTNKQFGDIGGAIGLKPSTQQIFEVYYWSTDHYYDAKKNYPDDSRSRQTFTTGVMTDWRFNEQFRLFVDFQFDKPLSWDRQSRDYEYEYWRRQSTIRLDMGNDRSIAGYVSVEQEDKQEGKIFKISETLNFEKSMLRSVDIYETAVYHTAGTTLVTTGVQAIQRDATYEFAADEGVTDEDLVETPGPDTSVRRELGYFATAYFGSGLDVNTQVGIFLNQVEIDESSIDETAAQTSTDQEIREFRETEIKLQTAWDFLITQEARILLNLTWDIDQLQKDYPYSDRGFKPWGGGNIQFLAVF